MAERRQTALGVARARFVEGLPRKAREVRASLALLAGTPDEERPREELRRRLHALYASAQVFRIEALAAALKDTLAGIDAVRDARRGFTQDELDALANLAATLPALGRGGEESDTPSVAGAEAPELEEPEPDPAPRAPRPPAHAPQPQPRRTTGVATAVISVLVVDAPEEQARIRAALPPERFEIVCASTADEALRLARSSAPDVVLADRALALAPGADLIGRLRDDPLTDFVPVVLLVAGGALDPIAAREAGADDAIQKPLDAATVRKTVERVASTLAGPAGASTLTGDLTVEELAERLADEVKRGIVLAAEKGRDVAVPVGDGTALLAATWSAIGRVRAHIAERSGGRVRFREGPARGGPAFVSVVGEEDAADEDELPEGFTLAGRRVLVCDDDPAVVWFFAGLFREHGADVAETSDGLEALDDARRRRPDLILSDILMPRLDGFGLTRALKRDPILADVPVILLSWKEDFLQRMRELKAGASGYLRKEAAAAHILAAVRDALRPRVRLESRLRAGGDVRGRLEEVGLATLLSTVAAERPDARLSVRDASSLYEVDIRSGELVDVNRTASDGMFARGPRMLEAMLGITTGRYTVADADGPVRRSLEGSTAALIDAGMRSLAARVDAVSGKNLSKVREVELDEETLAAVLRSSPEEVERIAGHLRRGRPPRELLLDGQVEPQVLEGVLTDLARQGAIRGVRGPRGEDRVALAREAREQGESPELTEHEDHGTLSWLPPGRKLESEPADTLEDEELAELESLRPPSGESRRPLEELEPPPARHRARKTKSSTEITILDQPFGDEPASVPPPPPGGPDDGDPVLETGSWDEDEDDDEEYEDDDDADDVETDGDDEDEDDDDETGDDADESDDDESDDDGEDEGDDLEGDEDDEESGSEEVGEEEAHASDAAQPGVQGELAARSEGARAPIVPMADLPLAEDGDVGLKVPPAPKLVEERPAPQRPEPSEGTAIPKIAWAVAVVVLLATGYVAWQSFGTPAPEDPIGPLPPGEHTASPPEPIAPRDPDPTAPPEPGDPPEDLAGVPPAYGREETGIADVGATVADGQGLVVLEPGPAPLAVQIGERRIALGAEPIGVPLDPGVHHLTYQRGDNQDFIWVAVHAGRTRYVPPLP